MRTIFIPSFAFAVIAVAAGASCVFMTGCAGTPTSSSAVVTVSPTTLAFPVTAIGSTAAATVTVSATTDVALGVNGSNTAEFPFSTSCTATMKAGSSCSITVQFRPALPGARSAYLAITSSSGNSTVAVSGTASGAPQTAEQDPSFTLVIATQQPNPFYLAPGQTAQLAALAVSASGGSQDVTAAATWTSSDAGVASVSPAGVVTAIAGGNATISVNYRGHSTFIRLFVVPA
jgi:hypothetical protein